MFTSKQLINQERELAGADWPTNIAAVGPDNYLAHPPVLFHLLL